MKKATLQIRVTVIAGLILIAACLLLTANSLFSARNYYGDYTQLLAEGVVEYDPALEENEVPSALNPGVYYEDASQKFSIQLVAVMILIVILALAAVYWAARQILRPLEELTRSVQEVDEEHLDQRVRLTGAQGEVLALEESYNRMLERLEEAFLIQKSFASNAAHELKTPLAVIKSSLQVLELNPQPEAEDYQEFMEDTAQSLERIIKTVDSLLSLANLASAPTDAVVELRPLLEQSVQELTAYAGTCGVKLSVSGEEDVAVYGNNSLLYRVFYNLIENAIKYNRPGGTVKAMLEQKETGVCIEVRDTGIGMEAECLNHIFEPFYRGDQSRSQEIPGSGLGLAVVKMILERHGGKIAVSSEPGAGFVIQITLPLEKDPVF